MIIGNGSIAKLLINQERMILFASGVSNSQCTDDNEYQREIDLVNKITPDSGEVFVYFSSILCEFPVNTKYGLHKLYMEQLIKNKGCSYFILRIGNIWEDTNPNTFLNYIKSHPEAEIRWDEEKYMVRASEINTELIRFDYPCTMTLWGEKLTVRECLSRLSM